MIKMRLKGGNKKKPTCVHAHIFTSKINQKFKIKQMLHWKGGKLKLHVIRYIQYIYSMYYLPKSISNITALAPSTNTLFPSFIALLTNGTVSHTRGSNLFLYSCIVYSSDDNNYCGISQKDLPIRGEPLKRDTVPGLFSIVYICTCKYFNLQ